MAGQRSKRSSRKRRQTGATPRAVPSQRRDHRTTREIEARNQRQQTARVDPRGERPPNPFGGVPVSEISILAGIVTAVVGYLSGGGPALFVGVLLCALGVLEFTAREHLAGYRSHSTLLAAIPTVAVEFVLVQIIPSSWPRATSLIGDAIVFGVAFWLLRKRFARAKQTRVARVARPPRA